MTLRIEDTGDDFDLNKVKGKGGLGLISMEERVRLVNGKFTIQFQPGKGTTVEVFVPLASAKGPEGARLARVTKRAKGADTARFGPVSSGRKRKQSPQPPARCRSIISTHAILSGRWARKSSGIAASETDQRAIDSRRFDLHARLEPDASRDAPSHRWRSFWHNRIR